MLDFLKISTRSPKEGIIEIYPKFIIKKSSDLMLRGGDFYAIWLEDIGLWSTDEDDVTRLVDYELSKYTKEKRNTYEGQIKTLYMWDADSGVIDKWHKYCQKQLRDNYQMLDEKIIFANTETTKQDYASKKLAYSIEKGDITAYEKLISTLYSDEERMKIEWAIGSIVSGDSKRIQKFMVLYGEGGTGKSTVLNIIQDLFDGYHAVFDAKALGSSSQTFALEPFKTNPLLAIQHDGDLSKIEDNTRLNSLVSHEHMTINEKFKSTYSNRFKCFLFVGTNKPVRITDGKSGLIRRLIDVSPSGNKVPTKEYDQLIKQIGFEYGAIAYHCREIYLRNKTIYDGYIPKAMLGASNDFYNFVEDSYFQFKLDNGVSLKSAWEMYKVYCEDTKVPYPYQQRIFKEELKNYFWEFKDRYEMSDGIRVRNYYLNFRSEKFKPSDETIAIDASPNLPVIAFDGTSSIFDEECVDCFAQYATDNGTPMKSWDTVKTQLSDIDTAKLHYVKVPENHIVIDFDIPDENGNKSFKRNLEEASKWPATYTELSKSGGGIHLHYIYTGDASMLSRVYDDHIEVKVYSGKSALRRKLTKFNQLPIATISSGLPLKGEQKMVNFEGIKNEKHLRTLIKKNLNKEIHPSTKSSVDFIYKNLNDAYASNFKYDVTDMRNAILGFAANSTNNAAYCIELITKMQFRSEEISENTDKEDTDMIFYDCEVFPNLFVVCWTRDGEDKPVVRMINPGPEEIEELLKFRLVGFNCRRYDNHILYARLMGYTNEQLYKLSQRIISNEKSSKNVLFGEAYNLSYTDIYDFASAGNKKSLKKLEIEMGIHHQELGIPWDKPVPEKLWDKVADYCCNDVVATKASFYHLSADWTARQILSSIAGMTVNDTTNALTTRIIFNKCSKPQDQFNYRNLAEPVSKIDLDTKSFLTENCPVMMSKPFKPSEFPDLGYESILPYFPGYKYEFGKSTYRDLLIGEGGYVFAIPGMYGNVALLDIISMHPNSAIAEAIFGVKFTRAFAEIVNGRVGIKHEAWDTVNHILNGKLTPYIQKVINGEMTAKELADALKTAINSVYGLTSAHFDNQFRDSRNVDNIIAKRGALFMVDLKYEVEKQGFTVAHIKTDSIKIPDASLAIIQFVMALGQKYGYTFEHEATYDRMCIVNDAVYIAKYASKEACQAMYDYIPGDNNKKELQWTATGTQFAVPYVFKKLFSKEDIVFEDLCETKSVVKGTINLDMNEQLPDVSIEEKDLEKLIKLAKKSEIDLDVSGNSGDSELDTIIAKIDTGHNYIFVGRVGQFCPIKQGCNGGVLYRENDGKYYAVTGTKGYRWLESEMVRELNRADDIDRSYYDRLVDDAVMSISEYGDFEWFVSDDPYVSPPYNKKGEPVYLDFGTIQTGYDVIPSDSLPESFEKVRRGA